MQESFLLQALRLQGAGFPKQVVIAISENLHHKRKIEANPERAARSSKES